LPTLDPSLMTMPAVNAPPILVLENSSSSDFGSGADFWSGPCGRSAQALSFGSHGFRNEGNSGKGFGGGKMGKSKGKIEGVGRLDAWDGWEDLFAPGAMLPMPWVVPGMPEGTVAKQIILPQGDEHLLAIEKVKSFQKKDTTDAWHKWVEAHGSTKRDPSRHTQEFLEAFLTSVSQAPRCDQAHLDEYHQWLINKVKAGQRSSDEFKQAWYVYCDKGGGGRDPARHTQDSLMEFLNEAPHFEEIPVHRTKDGGPSLQQLVEMGQLDESKAALVEQIKFGQRKSDEFKTAWWNFCALRGKQNDPLRHDNAALEEFLSFAPRVQHTQKGKSKGNKDPRWNPW